MRLSRRYKGPKTKKCQHYDDVAAVCQRVIDGQIEHTEVGLKHLAEEYFLLHLEFEALRSHLASVHSGAIE